MDIFKVRQRVSLGETRLKVNIASDRWALGRIAYLGSDVHRLIDAR